MIKQLIKRLLNYNYTPPVGRVNLGHLNRTTPFSHSFGYDRGGPVDRHYIEQFLERNKQFIRGRVLEIGDNDYTLKFGGTAVTQSDILHIDESNPHATLIGDLSNVPHIDDAQFDCIVLTQTLHLIYDFHKAIASCHRLLKPGGILLITVPGITQIDQGEWKNIWLWSFTETSLRRVLSEQFTNPKVETFGNVLVATAFLYGMGLTEIKRSQLDEKDEHYPVIITGVAKKG